MSIIGYNRSHLACNARLGHREGPAHDLGGPPETVFSICWVGRREVAWWGALLGKMHRRLHCFSFNTGRLPGGGFHPESHHEGSFLTPKVEEVGTYHESEERTEGEGSILGRRD